MILNRAFTLIELLVVIAIIGVLSSVILASLNSARSKGTDASTKSNIHNARAQAELYFDATSNSYSGVCANSLTGIGKMMAAAASSSGTTFDAAIGNPGTATKTSCHDTAAGWAAAAPLKALTPQSYYCVDSRGIAKITTSVLAANSVTCP